MTKPSVFYGGAVLTTFCNIVKVAIANHGLQLSISFLSTVAAATITIKEFVPIIPKTIRKPLVYVVIVLFLLYVIGLMCYVYGFQVGGNNPQHSINQYVANPLPLLTNDSFKSLTPQSEPATQFTFSGIDIVGQRILCDLRLGYVEQDRMRGCPFTMRQEVFFRKHSAGITGVRFPFRTSSISGTPTIIGSDAVLVFRGVPYPPSGITDQFRNTKNGNVVTNRLVDFDISRANVDDLMFAQVTQSILDTTENFPEVQVGLVTSGATSESGQILVRLPDDCSIIDGTLQLTKRPLIDAINPPQTIGQPPDATSEDQVYTKEQLSRITWSESGKALLWSIDTEPNMRYRITFTIKRDPLPARQ